MSLAVQDNGGLWVSDVVYVFDDNFNIYWMSDPDVRHSKAILVNLQVAGTITVSNKSKESDDVLQGDSWYMPKPQFMDVINEELWGYDKQKLQF